MFFCQILVIFCWNTVTVDNFCSNMIYFKVSKYYRVTRGGGAYKLYPQNINFWKMFDQKMYSITCSIIWGSMLSKKNFWPRNIFYALKWVILGQNWPFLYWKISLRKIFGIKNFGGKNFRLIFFTEFKSHRNFSYLMYVFHSQISYPVTSPQLFTCNSQLTSQLLPSVSLVIPQ